MSYSDQDEEKGVFERWMERLRRMASRSEGYAPVMVPSLRCGGAADPEKVLHTDLCTAGKCHGARNFGTGCSEIAFSGE